MSGDIEQEQIRSAREYDDTLAAGVGLESPAGLLLRDDINAILSQINRNIGQTNWYDLTNWSLEAAATKKLAYTEPFDPGVQQIVLGAGAQGVLIQASDITNTPKTLAVGAGSTTNGGVFVAAEANFTIAGTLGVGLSTIVDAAGNALNKVDITDTNNDPVLDSGNQVFGLAQTITGTGDGTAIAANPAENLQISFVTLVGGALTAVTLPAATYNFNLTRCTTLKDAPVGVLLGGNSTSPDIIDPGQAVPQLPYRLITISAPGPLVGPAASDPLNIQTGVFTTAGAQTVTETFGTTLLPGSAAAFNNDNRIKVWRNGVLQAKGLRVTWISTTQLAFDRRLFINERIIIETPSSY